MKIFKHWLLSLLLLLVTVLGVQLAWKLTVSETGWSPYLDQWAAAASGLTGMSQQLGDRDPVDQAKFWLREVKRCHQANNNREIAIGTAWILDSPQLGFIRRHIRLRDDLKLSGLPLKWRRELDTDTVTAMSAEFESLCRDECLAYVERAVQLDPSNREMRRAQAFMAFHTEFIGLDFQPRQDDYLTVLDACSQADPDNSLYDYLAAVSLWKSSADYSSEDKGFVLKVHDKVRYEEGNRRLAAGLAKPGLMFRTGGYVATLRFLDETKLSPFESLRAAESRLIDDRTTKLLSSITRWKEVECDEAKRAGRFDTAISGVRQVLSISNQIEESGDTSSPMYTRLILRRWSLANLAHIYEHRPDVMSPEDASLISKQLAEVQLELEILNEVKRRTAKNTRSDSEIFPASKSVLANALLPVFVIAITPPLVITSLLLALILYVISMFLRKGDAIERVPFGWFGHIVAWIVATSASFVLLGMFPAEIASSRLQTWLVCSAVWIGFVTLFLGCLLLLQRRFQLTAETVAALAIINSLPMIALVHGRNIIDLAVTGIAILHPAFSVIVILLLSLICWRAIYILWMFMKDGDRSCRSKMIAATALSLITVVGVLAGTALGTISQGIDAQTWIPAKVWAEAEGLHLDARELQRVIMLSGSKWIWAFIQWRIHYGPVIIPVLVVIVLMVWHLVRQACRIEGGWSQILRTRKSIALRQACELACKSCIVAGLFVLAINLRTNTALVNQMDNCYRVLRTRLLESSLAWGDVVKHVGEIRADEKTMSRLQTQVDKRNQEIAEQEAWLKNEK